MNRRDPLRRTDLRDDKFRLIGSGAGQLERGLKAFDEARWEKFDVQHIGFDNIAPRVMESLLKKTIAKVKQFHSTTVSLQEENANLKLENANLKFENADLNLVMRRMNIIPK